MLERELAHWGVRAPLEYLAVGFGSHHWRAGDAFVTVDDLAAGFQAGADAGDAFTALVRAYSTAAALRDAGGLEFVLAPLRDDEGTLIRRVSERYAVSVTPFVEGTAGSWGPYGSKDERRRMGELLGRLHAAGAVVPADLPLRDELTIPSRAALEEALSSTSASWGAGPYAEATRALLAPRAGELRERLAAYDADAARVGARAGGWVVTHGEPHRANVLVDTNGRLLLIDWDTTRVAPRERDLWLVLDDELTGWDEYAAVMGDASLDLEALGVYRRWWDLADIAGFVADLRAVKDENENAAAIFAGLRGYLSDE